MVYKHLVTFKMSLIPGSLLSSGLIFYWNFEKLYQLSSFYSLSWKQQDVRSFFTLERQSPYLGPATEKAGSYTPDFTHMFDSCMIPEDRSWHERSWSLKEKFSYIGFGEFHVWFSELEWRPWICFQAHWGVSDVNLCCYRWVVSFRTNWHFFKVAVFFPRWTGISNLRYHKSM